MKEALLLAAFLLMALAGLVLMERVDGFIRDHVGEPEEGAEDRSPNGNGKEENGRTLNAMFAKKWYNQGVEGLAMQRRRYAPMALPRVVEEEAEGDKGGRGRLRIYLGYGAGVGKTCAMLKAAHQARKRGVDVVAGWVDTHGQPKTQALLVGLEQLPRKGPGPGAGELDLDGALARRPQLILVDQLAHANGPGCRHSKRYQDVGELLGAGIDVYTTLNVEHIESLNDAVAVLTGVVVGERVPDQVFDRADQVELVDMEPGDLIKRYKAGEICLQGHGRQAAERFFTLQSLTALREIALRRCADRVNRLAGGAGSLGEEHVLACLSSSPSNPKIIRTAARMAAAFHGRFTALFVETPGLKRMEEEDRERLRGNIRLARQLGAVVETAYGDDIAYQIAQFARLSGASAIVLGRSAAPRGRLWRKTALADQLIARAPGLDVHVIPDGREDYGYRPRSGRLAAFSWVDLLKSGGILLCATGLSLAFYQMGFTDANIIMAYILGVLVTSILTNHWAYSMVSAIASVAIFNFLFTEPRFTLHAYEMGYPATFLVMFLTAYITGTLAVRLKDQARQSAQAAYRTRILLDTDQLLSRAKDRQAIAGALAGQMVKLLKRDVVIYLAEEGELGFPQVFAAGERPGETLTTPQEADVARWVFRNNKQAGATTDTLSAAQGLYLAIRVQQKVYGVAGVAVREAPLDGFEYSVLLSILGEGALALENEKNAREKEAATVLAKNEQLRANLLRAISHDLRTPLTSILGNASNLMSNSVSLDEANRRQICAGIYDDAIWLINLVENLLSVTRIEEGRMNLHLSAELMDEVIAEALQHINRKSVEHEIRTSSQEEFILARMDARLIVQVVINVVDNAIKYTPPGSHILIETRKAEGWVHVRISDDGPGIPPEAKAHVFDMFYCGGAVISDSRRSLGLGLALCKAIVAAHGGSIWVEDNQPHGAIFEFTLPAEEVSLHE